MTRRASQLLLAIQYNPGPEKEEGLNDWSNLHTPNILRIPGMAWGMRYARVSGERKYLVLYGIDDESALEAIYGPDMSRRSRWFHGDGVKKERMAPNEHAVLANLYEQVSGPPLGKEFLVADRPLTFSICDVHPSREAEWNRWMDTHHLPTQLKEPGRLAAARFRLIDHPVTGWRSFPMGPKYALIWEFRGTEEMLAADDPAKITGLAAAKEYKHAMEYAMPMIATWASWAYRPQSKFWKPPPLALGD